MSHSPQPSAGALRCHHEACNPPGARSVQSRTYCPPPSLARSPIWPLSHRVLGLDGPGTTGGSGRFVCGGSVLLRGEKRVKVCMARIVPNYSAFRKRNRTLVAQNFARCAMAVPRRKSAHQWLSLCRWRRFLFAIPNTQPFRLRCRCESTVSCDEDGFEPRNTDSTSQDTASPKARRQAFCV